MNSEELECITQSIIDKLGNETSAIILDDLTSIITKNNNTIQTIKDKDSEIAKLKNRNDLLVDSNSKLMQQVPRGIENPESNKKEETLENTKIDLRSCFDEYGRLKSKL